MIETQSLENLFYNSPTPALLLLTDAPKFSVMAGNHAYLQKNACNEQTLVYTRLFDLLTEKTSTTTLDDACSLVKLLYKLIGEQSLLSEQPESGNDLFFSDDYSAISSKVIIPNFCVYPNKDYSRVIVEFNNTGENESIVSKPTDSNTSGILDNITNYWFEL